MECSTATHMETLEQCLPRLQKNIVLLVNKFCPAKKNKLDFFHCNLGFSVEVFYCIAGKAKLQFVSIFFKRKPAFMKERYVC